MIQFRCLHGLMGLCIVSGGLGCSTVTPPISAAPPPTRPERSVAVAPVPGPAASTQPPSAPEPEVAVRPKLAPADMELWLPNFYRALHELSLARRSGHVRIAWFGDSHSAADFWTGELRRKLQGRFGNGGPGFVHLGIKSARHDQVLSKRFGKWRTSPKSPASYEPQGDGIFGLGGLRAEAASYAAHLQFRLMPAARAQLPKDEPIHWELIWRLPAARSEFTLTAGNQAPQRFTFTGGVGTSELDRGMRVRASQLMGVRFSTKPKDRIRVHRTANDPQFFGVIGELSRPGVVVDTLGINGARLRTMLAWPEGPWLGELSEREPQLVVLAYGTNEVGDGTALERYKTLYAKLLGRYRDVLPAADCLLVGPTERTDPEWVTLHRVKEIDRLQAEVAAELGCAYHSPLAVMLNSGGGRQWNLASPQLAASDRIHLTRQGYHKLAGALYEELEASYERLYGEPSSSGP